MATSTYMVTRSIARARARARRLKTNKIDKRKRKTPVERVEKCNNRRITRACAVTPTVDADISGSENRSTIFDNDEDRPISLADFDESATRNPSIPTIIELMKEFPFDNSSENQDDESTFKSRALYKKQKIDDHYENDENGLDQDWTKKIAVITESSGNLIEDLEDMHIVCDDSSTSSMTTIIGSERSSRADIDGDLDDIFRSEDEKEEENVGDGDDDDDCSDVDPLHSNRFVIFGDDYDIRKECKDCSTCVTDFTSMISLKKTVPSRPKTSRINPMTGRRSLTDDMQEWRNKVLSSWTLATPKTTKKYNTRKAKHKKRGLAVGTHEYMLRRTTDSTQTTINADVTKILKHSSIKRRRALQNIAPYNLPGVKDRVENVAGKPQERVPRRDLYHNQVARTHGLPKDCKTTEDFPAPNKCQNHSLNRLENKKGDLTPLIPEPKRFTIKVRIGSTIFTPDDEIGELQIPSEVIGSCKSPNFSIIEDKSEAKNVTEKNKTRRGSRTHPNTDRSLSGCLRIAKRFPYYRNKYKRSGKSKLFFGTIVSTRIEAESNESCTKIWHVLYDDGDEEDVDKSELNRALKLYKSKKRFDRNRRKKEEEWRHVAISSKERSNNTTRTKQAGQVGSREKLPKQEPHNPRIFLHQTQISGSESPKTVSDRQKMMARSSSKNSKQIELNTVPQRETMGLCSRHVPLLSDDTGSKGEESDGDSIYIVGVVDLTEDTEKVETIRDVVDLTDEI